MSDQENSQLRVIASGEDCFGVEEVAGAGGVSWLSHVGHLRSRNEDRFLVKSVWDGRFLLLLVADGAGGHEAGDAAAAATVETFDEFFSGTGEQPAEGDPRIWLHDTLLIAHDRVVDLATSSIRPPASTAVGVLVELSSLCAWRFHVGDSRLYVRAMTGMVSQWTRDHNITNGLIDRGLSVEQAMKIADGGRLTQVVGGTSDIAPEIHGPLQLEPGQVLLLCSDGIYGHNDDSEILPASMKPGDIDRKLDQLREGVLRGDAPDNLTAVLWQIDQELSVGGDWEVVTNSMPSLSAEAIASYIAARERASASLRREVLDDDEAPTDSSLSPEEAPTMIDMDAHPGDRSQFRAAHASGEDTLNTLRVAGPPVPPLDAPYGGTVPSSMERSSVALEATAAAVDFAVSEAGKDTRTALLMFLGLVAVLAATFTTIVKDMRGEVGPERVEALHPQSVPGASSPPEMPELPGDPEHSDPEVELPGEPRSGAEAVPEESGVDEELPGEPEHSALVGSKALESEESLEGSVTEPAVELPGAAEIESP